LDLIYLILEGTGKPTFRVLDLTRKNGNVTDEMIGQLFTKADRVDRSNLENWLGTYFDEVPIGPCTYAIRWLTYCKAKELDSTHPMRDAWKEIAPVAIEMIEFIMDVRKGDFTDQQIKIKMQRIKQLSQEIELAQSKGNWFAKTVTTGTIRDVGKFVSTFSTLQEFLDLITCGGNS